MVDRDGQPLNTLAQERLGIDIAPYLRPRKRGRGEYPRHARPWALHRTIEDVRTIRAIWREAYGRWKRKDDLAEEIAAERHCVDLDDVCKALKGASRTSRI